jgi:hypothetical protein
MSFKIQWINLEDINLIKYWKLSKAWWFYNLKMCMQLAEFRRPNSNFKYSY